MKLLSILLIATTILSLHKPNETREFGFTETHVMPKMNKTTVSEGTMHFKAPDDLRMDYTKPAGDYTLIAKDKFDVFKGGKMQHLNVKDPKQKMAIYRATLLACIGGDVEKAAQLNNAKPTTRRSATPMSARSKPRMPHRGTLRLSNSSTTASPDSCSL